MYVLYAQDKTMLAKRSTLFEQRMEPLLQVLEMAHNDGTIPASLPEISRYLDVCRWPFRKLEYSFVLDVLLNHLQPGNRYLDAGCGVTPLAHTIAMRGIQVDACDGDERQITELQRLRPERIYGSNVRYLTQDLTKLTYQSETFDAISCVSVLEHIPSPLDQEAIKELLRVLKPGGVLVVSVDFTPPAPHIIQRNKLAYYLQRATQLARKGDMHELKAGLARKLHAQQVVAHGDARVARSANQCFEISHLEQDILPLFKGQEISSNLPFSSDLRSVTPTDARHFWELEHDLYNNQGQRAVLPVAFIVQKSVLAMSVVA
ncbi:MAG: class I SAM-dependent methyltransferase [Chloroflexota bacterium]